ncbi:MAG: hypothetical protein J0L58_20770 [Burkholderiales bacterium]|nr:hypothetical protein [Burkholderiales bacterium]
MHGSGLKGAERERLKGADPRLRQRISVYVANANGVQPEAGVGGYLHGVKLNNLYDVAADPLGLVKQGGSANAWEARILDAGFDGYLNPKVLPTPQAVLLGPHSVKVDYLGQHTKLTPAEPRMSRDEDSDWQPDVFYGDVEKISDDDYNLDALKQDELDDEMGQRRTGRQELTVNPTTVRAAGIMMEAGAPLLDYRESGSGLLAAVRHEGSDYFFKVEPSGFSGEWAGIPDSPRGEFGSPLSLRGVSEAAARSYNQRAAASIVLHADGYDLLRQVDKKAADRIAKTWEALRGKEGAFEFEDPLPSIGKPGGFTSAAFVARAQQIADTMLAGKKHQFDVSGQGNMLNFALRDAVASDAQIELDDDGREKRIYLHAINLDRGSGAGKAFYQVAAQVAKDFGAKVMADPQGLTAVNTYRRTEQMLSAHLRGGSTMQPGYGQRVYGWEPGKSKAAERNNLIRLALAAARNAKELAPAADQLRYDPATGKFTIRGEDAEAHFKKT